MVVDAKQTTVEAFEKFIRLPENADKKFEWIGGEIVEVPTNMVTSRIALLIGAAIVWYLSQNDIGYATGADGGYQVSGERYAPDVGFISKQRQPEPSTETYNPLAPDLAIEVMSPSDLLHNTRIKVVNYLAAGTVVWLVRPDIKVVEVYVSGQPVQVIHEDGTLDGGTVLPDFKLAVKDIFK